jgi:hypothetical protein
MNTKVDDCSGSDNRKAYRPLIGTAVWLYLADGRCLKVTMPDPGQVEFLMEESDSEEIRLLFSCSWRDLLPLLQRMLEIWSPRPEWGPMDPMRPR